jgi:predicted signal transduction protein with EAL and GGDEF domain
VAEVFDTKRPRTIITPTILPTGIYTYEVRDSPIIGPDGNSKAVLSLPFDITERLESEQKIRTLAFYDDLTGLPNRALFLERLDGALHSARQHERTVALLFIDLDHFK